MLHKKKIEFDVTFPRESCIPLCNSNAVILNLHEGGVTMTEQKIKEIFADEAFVASLMNMETPEDVQKALAERGLDLSVEEIEKIREMADSQEGELSDDALEDVAGGSVTAIICGLIIGGAAASGAFKLGQAVNNWTRRRW